MKDEQITAMIEGAVRRAAPPGVKYPDHLDLDLKLADLNVDSVALVEAVVAIERAVHATFTDSEISGVRTLRDLVGMVRAKSG